MNDGATVGFWGSGSGRLRAILAAVAVLALAGGALLWPGADSARKRGVFLVFDSSGSAARESVVYRPLANYLVEFSGRPLDMRVVATVEAFQDELTGGVDFALCPDGLALDFDAEEFVPVVVGRRAAPRNLRPRGVLVYRKTAGFVPSPWISRPAATVCGDSVSLTATGAWRREGENPIPGPAKPFACAWGPDPYDHGPALHAARLGGFDYALVRQWDADRFFSAGLLSHLEWEVEILTIPVPDIVLFASRDVPGHKRLEVGDGLAGLGRSGDEQSPLIRDLQRGIAGLNLVGFNHLVDPDFDLVRRNFVGNWPPDGD